MALKTSLISYWKLGEASGNRVDSHGSNTLTDNNTVTQAAGKIGNAAQFTAASSEYLSIVDNAGISTGNIDFSIAGWVYLDSKASSRRIFSKTDNTDSEYNLFYRQSTDRFQFDINSGGIAVAASTLGSPSTATWYFIVAWHDAAGDTLNIQINNGTADSTATAGVGPSDTAYGLQLGRLGTDYMDGRIDDTAFWKRTLSSDERTQLYNGGNGLSYDVWDITGTGGSFIFNMI